MKTTYRINGRVTGADEPQLQALLAGVHGARSRPRCLCRNGTDGNGIEMYVAHVGDKYVLKRMPDSGSAHHPTCDSFEPPPELSGLAEVRGTAITEHPHDGTTALTLGFPLARTGSRAAPVASEGSEATHAHSDGTKLSLRGLLHYLWDEAGLTRWYPAMAGKRNWGVIRRHVRNAAAGKTAKRQPLAANLFVPEPFTPDRKAELAARRSAAVMPIAASEKGRHQLMLVVGEVKDIAPARFGHKIVLKHLPDFPLMAADDLHRRLRKAFAVEFALWEAVDGAHLVAIGTFGVAPSGVATLEQAALMVTTPNWIPFESTFDIALLDALTAAQRPFVKSLRYNVASTKPVATAVLTDTEPATALYVLTPGTSADYRTELTALVAGSSLDSWTWDTTNGQAMPGPTDDQGDDTCLTRRTTSWNLLPR